MPEARSRVGDAPGFDPAALSYARALSVDEALGALAAGAIPLAGGTLLTPAIAHQNLDRSLIDISRIASLRALRREGDAFDVGALVTHAELAASAEVASAFPALAEAARSVGNPQVRAAGTVGGNVACRLARASLPAVLLVLDAEVVLRGRAGESTVPLSRALQEGVPVGALIVALRLPTEARRRAAHVKFAWRHTSAKALAAVAVSIVIDEGRVRSPRIAASAICVAQRLRRAEALLEGRALDGAVIAAVAREAAGEPPFALDADAVPVGEAYRRRLVGHGVARLLEELATR